MNKEKLIERIGEIPQFVKRDVAIKQEDVTTQNTWIESQKDKAITEEGNYIPMAFVTKKYQIVQFRDVFIPMIENIPDLEGGLVYYQGKAYMSIFPSDDRLKISDNESIGIFALNSVDSTTSVIIKFCVKYGDKVITIPKKIAGLKRVHMGKVNLVVDNYIYAVDKIRNIWTTVINEFQKMTIDENFMNTVIEDIGIKDKYIIKKIKKAVMEKSGYNLWDMFMDIVESVEDKSYKTELHRQKKLDLISEKMFGYAILSKMIAV